MRRSPTEILFRIRQEAENLRAYLRGPRLPVGWQPRKLPLPAGEVVAARLRNTRFAADVIATAEAVLRGKFAMLSYEIETGSEVRWRRDYVHSRETEPRYFRSIPYLDFAQTGDHKIVWELNRHAHLAVLAQAYLFTGRQEFLDRLFGLLESWLDQNPYCRGINWTSALEVAFRAFSWIWIEHWAGVRMPQALRERWMESLFHHGCYLENNLSIYFSPNTHLQGEALVLHALGALFGGTRQGARWQAEGGRITRELLSSHVLPDGSHFERSSYYHVYATDMLLFHAALEPPSQEYRTVLQRMAEYLWAIGASGQIPFLGDDDGGRLFHPFGDRREFSRATLAACAAFLGDTPWRGDPEDMHAIAAWWFPEAAPAANAMPVSRLFPDVGIATMFQDGVEIIAAGHAFGRGGAGHSHAHALHFTLRRLGKDVLLDPGTYTYVSDPQWRDRFRGTAAHNTVRLDGLDQADPAGPFRWVNLPRTRIVHWTGSPWYFHGECVARGLCHQRRMAVQDGVLFVLDRIEGSGRHRIEQFWHPAEAVEPIGESEFRLPGDVVLALPAGSAVTLDRGGEFGWYSAAPGSKIPLDVIRVEHEAEIPQVLAAAFSWNPRTRGPLQLEHSAGAITLRLGAAAYCFDLA